MTEDLKINKDEGKGEPGDSFIRKLPGKIIIRWSLFMLGLTGLVLLFPLGSTPQYSELKFNFISRQEIIAPFDFELLKSGEELASEREAARLAVMPVFMRLEETRAKRLAQLDSLLFDLKNLLFTPDYADIPDSVKFSRLDSINRKYRTNLTHDLTNFQIDQLTERWWRKLEDRLKTDLARAYKMGILDREPETINTAADAVTIISKGVERRVSFYSIFGMNLVKSTILANLKKAFPEGDNRVKAGYEISLNVIEPNLIYDERVTENRRNEAAGKVALAKGIVLKNERIIDSNERVTQEHLQKLRSLNLKKAELSAEEGGITRIFPFAGKVLFSGGILLLLGLMIFTYNPNTATNRSFLLILLILLSHLAFLQLILKATGISTILFPSALAAMLITIFFGYRIGFWFMGALALLAAAMQGNDFQLAMLTLLVGTVAIISVKNIRSRTQLLTSSLYLAVTYIVFLAGFHFMQYSFSTDLFRQIGLAVLNSVMTPILALGLAIILGNLFDITTDLTLLELSDLNRPLLKQLAAAAPGTYHHSLMVGTMAETAAEAVGANPLLARTAAYYHDLGKIEKRDFFIENQIVFNPHDALPPEESAAILNSHVVAGLEMAEKHRLPQVIKDVITQHHGTATMQYFYHKALKFNKEDVDREKFQYTGPIPVSKESGIIMLADAVEAAVRSMGDVPTREIREKVKQMIEEKFQEGQLDSCELSLKDLQTMEESFTATLKAHSHHRIAYPSSEDIEKEISRVTADNS